MFSLISQCYPDKPALVDQNQSISYQQLLNTVASLANGLSEQGYRPGDRCLLLLDNCPELVSMYYACYYAGITAVPLMGITRKETVADIVAEVQPRFVITASNYLEKVIDFKLNLDIWLTDALSASPNYRPFLQLMSKDFTLKLVNEDTKRTLLIVYTTGSTGKPKGAMHSAQTMLDMIQVMSKLYEYEPRDRTLILLSLAHAFSLASQIFPLLAIGATLYIAPYNCGVSEMASQLCQHAITVMVGVPSMYALLMQHAQAHPDEQYHLRLCLVGGDVTPRPLHTAFHATLGLWLTELIGMTETMLYASNPLCDDLKRIGTVGLAVPGVEIKIDAKAGERQGEILVRSPYLLQRYYHEKQARGQEWFHTGDIGMLDEDGYLWFLGRAKNLIIHDGYNISPLEIEAALYEHPAVKEAAVVGTPSDLYGEEIMAYVSVMPGAEPVAEGALNQLIAAKLEYYKQPKQISILAELPKNRLGKLDRLVLKQWSIPEGVA